MLLNALAAVQQSSSKLYVEDVFSTYLYTGTGASLTINSGIDLTGSGGLVWTKERSGPISAGYGVHSLIDTVRGGTQELASSSPDISYDIGASRGISFTGTGHVVSADPFHKNISGRTYAAWTFRKSSKFFDVVTWTGTGSARTIAHNLGVAPGCIMVKRMNAGSDWSVYHRGLANTEYMVLNSTAAKATGTTRWNSTAPTATEFTVGTDATVNASGGTYVAYLFAHDVTADGIIQCGSYTGNGSATGPSINLGWEPQWLLIKNATGNTFWQMLDTMRGMPVGAGDNVLYANDASSEYVSGAEFVSPTATGFSVNTTDGNYNASGGTYIYIAIRRGPMKTPTVGTSVFQPQATRGATNGTATSNIFTSNWPVDMLWQFYKPGGDSLSPISADRLRGGIKASYTSSTSAEGTGYGFKFDDQDGLYYSMNLSANSDISGLMFRRALGFFDVVCYTGGIGSPYNVSHNLGVTPQLVLYKARSSTSNWFGTYVINPAGGANSSITGLSLNSSSAGFSWNLSLTGGTFSATTIPVDGAFDFTGNNIPNASGVTYVAYLFASCPGVSKVGSYTGNGSSQTINCGFSSGARFFLVKRTDSTGDWWVYDSARGIVAAADPALALNSTAAEVTSADAVDTDSTGIIVNQEATCNINVNGATYIYLAIA